MKYHILLMTARGCGAIEGREGADDRVGFAVVNRQQQITGCRVLSGLGSVTGKANEIWNIVPSRWWGVCRKVGIFEGLRPLSFIAEDLG